MAVIPMQSNCNVVSNFTLSIEAIVNGQYGGYSVSKLVNSQCPQSFSS